MVTPPRKSAANRAPNVETRPAPGNAKLGWAILIGFIILVAAASQCSRRDNPANGSAADTNYAAALSNTVAAQGPLPVESVSTASVTRGIAHLHTAFTAEGFSGAMVYSQNCYDALAHHFTWAKLDQCGAFDALAARSIADADMTGLDNEASWFQSEAAAGRYLAAATGAGEQADEADRRISDIQRRAARSRTVGRRPAPSSDIGNTSGAEPIVDADGNPIDDTGSATQPAPQANRIDSAWLDRALNRRPSQVTGGK